MKTHFAMLMAGLMLGYIAGFFVGETVQEGRPSSAGWAIGGQGGAGGIAPGCIIETIEKTDPLSIRYTACPGTIAHEFDAGRGGNGGAPGQPGEPGK